MRGSGKAAIPTAIAERAPAFLVPLPSIGMNKLLLTTLVPDERTAWTKARIDACDILQQDGYSTLQLPMLSSPRKVASFWTALNKQMAGGGHMLIEYPFEQRKRSYLLYLFRLLAPVKLYALLHDLDSLRFSSAQGKEMVVLRLFDGLISHNPSMTRWLREKGYGKKIVDLYLFDYLNAQTTPFHEDGMSSPVNVLYAGNLSAVKASYIYRPDFPDLKDVRLSVFGPFFEPDKVQSASIVHKGTFDPGQPVLDRQYHFGLVWEGSSLDTCEGAYGRYLRYNSPHKASLYVSLGLPIVIWRGAALADFVVEQGIGLTINSLAELEELPSRLDSIAYRAMAERVDTLSRKVANGSFLKSAVTRLTD
jgi:hypothetical protein